MAGSSEDQKKARYDQIVNSETVKHCISEMERGVNSGTIPEHIGGIPSKPYYDARAAGATGDEVCASDTQPYPPKASTPSGGSKSAIIARLESRYSDHKRNARQFDRFCITEHAEAEKVRTAINILTLHPEAEIIVELLQLGVVL